MLQPSPHAVRRPRRASAVAIALACASLVWAMTAGEAAAKAPPRSGPTSADHAAAVIPGSTYLALGDSVTFGYEEPTVVPAPDYQKAGSFDGYPEMLGRELHLRIVNASCPGETSSSFIHVTAQSNGCENTPGSPSVGYRRAYPLHARYAGSQLGFALRYLRAHPGVRLVSLMIGANDLFVCQETTSDGCASHAEQQRALRVIEGNVRTILATLRHRARYTGQIAIVNYYSLDSASPVANAESAELNRAQDTAAGPYHVVVADAFRTFATASAHSGNNACTAGLLTQLGAPGTCGVHPSYAGQALLASTLEGAIAIR